MAVTIEHGPEHQRSRGAGRAVAFTALVSALLGGGVAMYFNSAPHGGASSVNGFRTEAASPAQTSGAPMECNPQNWANFYDPTVVEGAVHVSVQEYEEFGPNTRDARSYVCDPAVPAAHARYASLRE